MPDIAKVSGVAEASIAKIDGVAKANIASVSGISIPAGVGGKVTSGLVMHLDAGDSSSYSGSGTSWLDLTSSNIDFTLINNPTYSSTDGGGSFEFDGVDDEISSTYSASSPILFSANDLDTNGATIQLWAKNVTGQVIFFDTNSASNNHYYGLSVSPQSHSTNGQRLVAHIFEGTANNAPSSRRTAFSSYGTHSANTWYLFTFTYSSNESSDIGFHVNTTSVANSGTSGTGDDTSPGYDSSRFPAMGRVRGVARQGYVSQVMVYDKVLSASEITQNFDAFKSRYGYGDIVETDLVINLDAGNSNSYSGSGTTWSNLVSGTSFDFTLTNGPVYTADQGGYFQFDGVNDYATKTTLFNMADYPSFSIESWVYADNSSSDHSICGQWQNSPSGFGPGILYLDVGDGAVGWDWIVRLSDGTNKRIGTTIANGSVGAWNHVVATFNSTQMQLYVNNSLIGTVSTGDTIDDNTNEGLAIGADRDTGSRYMDGRISIFRFYEKVLSSTDIDQNYNAIKGRYGL